jgi:hypothetical protein
MSEWVGPRYGPVTSFFIHESTATASLGLLIVEISRSHWHTALGRTPLDERSARRRDRYLKKHKTVNRRTFIPPARFEPAIRAIHAFDRRPLGSAVNLHRQDENRWPTGKAEETECVRSRKNNTTADVSVYDTQFYIVHHILVWRAVLDKTVLSSSFGWSRSEITHGPAWREIKCFL